MAQYFLYADRPEKERADQRSTLVAQGADVAVARAAGEVLVGERALAPIAIADVSAPVPAFVIEGGTVGSRGQSTWPPQTRPGGSLEGCKRVVEAADYAACAIG